jgi:quercetin dioxygenase-like cupin family protein/ribosome-binding protein aMBF1 (putative translation factor)
MAEEKKETSYEVFRETVDAYAEHRGDDLLTDPAAVAASAKKEEQDSSSRHGENLRAAREKQGFTIEELAKRTGIPGETLAQMEVGETLLPLGQLIKLSKVLSLKMSELISTGHEQFTIVRANQRQSFERFGKAKQDRRGYEYVSLAPGKKDRVMEPFIVTLHPASPDEPSSHEGQEFIYVLDGEMEVLIGDTRDVLSAGDAIYYDSSTMHLVRAHGDAPTIILAVLTS